MQTERMTSLRDLIVDILNEAEHKIRTDDFLADAILAHPDIRAIIDLALRHVDRYDTPEVWALLADWRA